MIPTLAFGACLVLIGVALRVGHTWKWNDAQARAACGPEARFARRQMRRRGRASSLIMLLGGLIFASPWIEATRIMPWYWLGVLLLLAWSVALAVLDIFASRQHFGREQGEQDAQRALLARALRENAGGRRNLPPPKDAPPRT